MNLRLAITTIIGFLFFTNLHAQQPLELQQAIILMRENNTQLKVQEYEIKAAKAEHSGTLSGFLPYVTVSHTGFYTNDPLNAFGFKLQQSIVEATDFNPALLNDPDAMQHFNTKFSIKQPLFNFDVFSARKALKYKMNAMEYQKQFAENLLEIEIKKAYTNLQFLYEAQKAVSKGIVAYQEVLRNTQNLEKQGYAKTSDVLMVEVGLTDVQNRKIEIENNIANLSDYLSWLMGKESREVYIPTERLTQYFEVDRSSSKFSEDRADVLAMKSGIEAQNQMISMHNRALLPRINAFGEYNYYDRNIVGLGSNAYMAGLSLSWDIFNGNETLNKINQSRISSEKAETELQLYIEKNQLELQKAIRDLASNQAKISLTETAVAQARESLRILENRYAQGLEKTADLLVAQATDIEKEVNHLEAVKDYNLSVLQIEFLTR